MDNISINIVDEVIFFLKWFTFFELIEIFIAFDLL